MYLGTAVVMKPRNLEERYRPQEIHVRSTDIQIAIAKRPSSTAALLQSLKRLFGGDSKPSLKRYRSEPISGAVLHID